MEKKPITILYGTETGNAEDLANQTLERAEAAGLEVKLVGAMDFSVADLADTQRLICVISTWGEGDPPSEAEDFCHDLYDGNDVPDLSHLEFTVCALGDTGYDEFCGCGVKVDAALEKHGATRFHEIAKLDVDFDDDFEAWSDALFAKLEG